MILTRIFRFTGVLCLLLLLGSLWQQPGSRGSSISRHAFAQSKAPQLSVGSKNFTENRILAEIMAQLIEAKTPIKVRRRYNLGGTKVLLTALQKGEIDFYPDYTGTGWSIHLKRKERVNNSLKAYSIVQQESYIRLGLVWLAPFGFNNSFGLAMSEKKAEKLGIRTISDLRKHQELRVRCSHEFLNRKDGYLGLKETYGLAFKDIQGMEHGLAYAGIKSDKVDVIDTWTTDGKLLKYKLRVLIDDKHFFPPYDAAPVARKGLFQKHPQLRVLLNKLAFRFPNKVMQKLNLQVEEGQAFVKVARDFLLSQKLIKTSEATTKTGLDRRQGFVGFMLSRWQETLKLAGQHLYLTLLATFFAILFSVPVGVLLTRMPILAGPVMNAVGVIQTIPSLALLAFMIPIPGLGLGMRSAVVALFLYALLPIVRNTYTGIKGVNPKLIEAAKGMGLKDLQILTLIELPLATQTIMAGIRTSAVIGIGVATLAAFIGAGGLGDPIITGLQLNDTKMILSGAIPAALLAVLMDAGLGLVEKLLSPKGSQQEQH